MIKEKRNYSEKDILYILSEEMKKSYQNIVDSFLSEGDILVGVLDYQLMPKTDQNLFTVYNMKTGKDIAFKYSSIYMKDEKTKEDIYGIQVYPEEKEKKTSYLFANDRDGFLKASSGQLVQNMKEEIEGVLVK